MKISIRNSHVVLFLLAASLCVFFHSRAFALPNLANYKGNGGGWITASVSVPGSHNGEVRIDRTDAPGYLVFKQRSALMSSYESVSARYTSALPEPSSDPNLTFSDNNEFAQAIKTFRVPAGTYRIRRLSVFLGLGQNNYYKDEDADFSFTVGEGESVYLGRFEWILARDASSKSPVGWALAVTDMRNQDFEMAKGPKLPAQSARFIDSSLGDAAGWIRWR